MKTVLFHGSSHDDFFFSLSRWKTRKAIQWRQQGVFFMMRVSRRGNNVEEGEDILQNGEISVELIREDRLEILLFDRIFIIRSNNLEIFST